MDYSCEECFERQICSVCHKQICYCEEHQQGCRVIEHYKITSEFLTKRISPLVCMDCKIEQAFKKMSS